MVALADHLLARTRPRTGISRAARFSTVASESGANSEQRAQQRELALGHLGGGLEAREPRPGQRARAAAGRRRPRRSAPSIPNSATAQRRDHARRARWWPRRCSRPRRTRARAPRRRRAAASASARRPRPTRSRRRARPAARTPRPAAGTTAISASAVPAIRQPTASPSDSRPRRSTPSATAPPTQAADAPRGVEPADAAGADVEQLERGDHHEHVDRALHERRRGRGSRRSAAASARRRRCRARERASRSSRAPGSGSRCGGRGSCGMRWMRKAASRQTGGGHRERELGAGGRDQRAAGDRADEEARVVDPRSAPRWRPRAAPASARASAAARPARA